MKNATDIATSVTQSGQQSTQATNPGRLDSDEAAELVDRVFQVFDAHWPRKFATIWKSDEELDSSRRAWLRAFLRCSWLTPDTFEAGLERVVLQEWPPDNPGEFLQLCHRTPDMVSAPDATAAFHEACRGAHPGNVRQHNWSNKAVYWAAVRTGLQALMERPNKNEKRFHEKYQEALDQYETLDDPPAAELPHHTPEPGPEADAAAKQALADMKRALGA